MKCPKCGGKSRTVNQKLLKDGSVKRFRNCNDCGEEFATVEALLPCETSEAEAYSTKRRRLLLQLHTLSETLPSVIEKLGGFEMAEQIKYKKKLAESLD
jgi:rRNA maturation protein Nop10